MLIVTLCTFAFNVLLNGIDLGLVLNELLLNIVEAVVDFTLQDLVLFSVMLHVVVGDLLSERVLIDLQEFLDLTHSNLFVFELTLKILSFGKLVLHLILH